MEVPLLRRDLLPRYLFWTPGSKKPLRITSALLLRRQLSLEFDHGSEDREHDPAVGQARQRCPSDDDALLCAKVR